MGLTVIDPNSGIRDSGGNLFYTQGTMTYFGKNTSISVGITAIALPTTSLSNRKFIIIQNLGTAAIFIGFDNTVTSSGINQGLQILPNQSFTYYASDVISFYGISTASQTVIVQEGR